MPLSPSPASTTARDDVTSASVPADETGLAQTRQPPPFLTPPMQAYPASAGGAASSGAGAASYVASAAPPMQHAYYRTSADAAYAAAAAAAAAARNDHMHYPASLPSGPAFLNNSMLLGDISALTPPPPSIDCTRSGAGGVWSPYPAANTCAGLPQQAAPVSLLAPTTQTQPPNPAAAGNPGAVGAAAPAPAAAVPPPSMMAAPAAVAAPTGPTRSGSTPASSPQPMRPRSRRRRRKYNEIERIYVCGYEGCTKAYGTLNHLNAHVLDHNHGPRRTPEEFSEIRAAWRERKRRQEREAMAQLALQQEQEASRAAAQLTPVFLEAPTYYDMLRHPSLRQPPPGPFAPPPHMLMPPHAPAVMNAYSQVPLAAVPPPPHPLYPYSHVTPGYECPAAAAAAAASAYPDGALWGGAYANYAGANYYKEGSSAGSRAPRTLGDGGPADNFGLSNT